jgi:L-ribulose-5-phosphate 4-epimerase
MPPSACILTTLGTHAIVALQPYATLRCHASGGRAGGRRNRIIGLFRCRKQLTAGTAITDRRPTSREDGVVTVEPPATDPHAAIRADAAAANRALAAAGLVQLSFGNASAVDRDLGVFAIKPSGVPCERMTPDDAVIIRIADGARVAGELRPSSDEPTHRLLYQELPQLGGVVHTHSRHATAWAQAERPIPCFGTTHADHFRGDVPVTRRLTDEEIAGEYELETGRVIVELYRDGGLDPEEAPGALVASHGPFVWGRDAAHAAEHAIALELMAELALNTIAIDPAREPIGKALLTRHFERKHGPRAYYGQR